jgi:hypothetical protein
MMHTAQIYAGYIFGLAAQAFWIWMIIDCIMNDPDRFIWLWVILLLNFPGAVIYFMARKPMSMKGMTPRFLAGFMRGKETAEAQYTARNVGNSYNYMKLGDIYLDTGRIEQAEEAFDKAIKLDPDNIQALWGSARVDIIRKNTDAAAAKLERVLKKDPEYKYGEPSLAYARILYGRRDKNGLAHLEAHIIKWAQPEAQFMLGSLLMENNQVERGRELLEAAVLDIKGAPGYYFKANRKWISRMKALLASQGQTGNRG